MLNGMKVALKQVKVNETKYNTITTKAEKLLITVTPPAGKKVKAVYGYWSANSDGIATQATPEELKLNDDGQYELTVVDGGGINLHVEYEDETTPEDKKQDETTTDEKKDEPKSEEAKPEEEKQTEATTDTKKDEPKQEQAKTDDTKDEVAAEHVHLASTGSGAASRVLPATGDMTSVASAAMFAIAGAGAVLASKRGRKE